MAFDLQHATKTLFAIVGAAMLLYQAAAAFYAEDATLVWPGAPAVHGFADLKAALAGMISGTPGISIRFTPERIDIADSGDLATDFGRVDFGHDLPSGHVVEVGKYLVAWKKVGGVWKVLFDSYNLNA